MLYRWYLYSYLSNQLVLVCSQQYVDPDEGHRPQHAGPSIFILRTPLTLMKLGVKPTLSVFRSYF